MNTKPYLYSCPNCKRQLGSSRLLTGKRVKCLACQSAFVAAGATKVPPIAVASFVAPPLAIPQPAPLASPLRVAPQRLPYIQPDELRVTGETAILFGTLTIAIALLLIASLATALLLAVLCLVIYIQAINSEAALCRSSFRVTKDSHPDLHFLVNNLARRLTMRTPTLLIARDDNINAHATFGTNPAGTVVLNSALVDIMDMNELAFIIGHELTHIKCGHCRYKVFTISTTNSMQNVGAALITDLLFRAWNRRSEFTCDRGGAVACKNPIAAMTALAKLERIPPEAMPAFIQACISQQPTASHLRATHPDTSNRIAAVYHYAATHDYRRLSSLWSS